MQSVSSPSGLSALTGEVFVAVDIGATNARVAVKEVAGGRGLMTVRKLAEIDKLLAFFNEVEAVLEAARVKVVSAAVAGPGPRNGAGTVLGPFANYTSQDKRLRLDALPAKLFPKSKTTLLNDLESAAYGVASISAEDTFHKSFKKMWGPNDAGKINLEDGPYLVLAVGTGCGVGLVHGDAGKVRVLPLEFGHTTIVPEKGDAEWLYELGRERYGVNKLAEYEDVVGGQGLLRCWERIRKEHGLQKLNDAAEVARRAKSGCPHANDALFLHYKYLFSLASDLSMGFVLGGVVIAGDNIMHNEFFISNPGNHEKLQRHFLEHTMERHGFQSRVTVFRQTENFSLNLEGGFFKAVEAGAAGVSKM